MTTGIISEIGIIMKGNFHIVCRHGETSLSNGTQNSAVLHGLQFQGNCSGYQMWSSMNGKHRLLCRAAQAQLFVHFIHSTVSRLIFTGFYVFPHPAAWSRTQLHLSRTLMCITMASCMMDSPSEWSAPAGSTSTRFLSTPRTAASPSTPTYFVVSRNWSESVNCASTVLEINGLRCLLHLLWHTFCKLNVADLYFVNQI